MFLLMESYICCTKEQNTANINYKLIEMMKMQGNLPFLISGIQYFQIQNLTGFIQLSPTFVFNTF